MLALSITACAVDDSADDDSSQDISAAELPSVSFPQTAQRALREPDHESSFREKCVDCHGGNGNEVMARPSPHLDEIAK